MAINIGTSGWHYDDWRGEVYPETAPRSRWFDLYQQRFGAVELNAPFYRLPTERAVVRWRDQAPEGFCYAVKGSRFTTHNLKIGGDRLPDSIERVTGAVRPLGDRLAVMLWQLPPMLHRDLARLDRFLGLLPGWTRHAVEFRHPSWSDADVDRVLADHDAARVWVSATGDEQPTTMTTDLAYLRLHGLSAEPYRHDYTDAELRPWVDRVAAAAADRATVHVYFNNDFHGHAVRNAERLVQLLEEADVAVAA